jgi:hypothetical protein
MSIVGILPDTNTGNTIVYCEEPVGAVTVDEDIDYVAASFLYTEDT